MTIGCETTDAAESPSLTDGGHPRGTDLSVGVDVMATARLCAVAFLGLFVLWVDLPHKLLVALVLAGVALGHLGWWWLHVRCAHPVSMVNAMATLLADTVGIGVAMLLTGGANSPVVLIWAANVAVAAIWIGVRRSLPVLAVTGAFLTAAVALDPTSELNLTEAQSAVFAFGILALVLTHGGVVAARQRAALSRIAAAEAEALRDPLTGLANRRAFEQRLPDEVERSERYRRPLSLLMIDLDDFKRVNDTRGHIAGDAVLVEVARQLRREMRAPDMVVRLGGEEFVMVLPETDEVAAFGLAERLRARILESSASDGVTVSIGVASTPKAASTAVGLIHTADEALYEAKRSGKNRTVIAGAAVMESDRSNV